MGNRAYVTTQSIKKLKNHLKEWALDPTDWTSTNHTEGKTKNINLVDLDMEKDQSIYYKERWIHENGLEQRLIVTFYPKYKRYHESIREKQIERALKKIDKPTQLGKKRANDPTRFIDSIHVTSDGEVAEKVSHTLNQGLIQVEAKYDGFYGVCTNLEDSVEEVVQITQRRWEIEETFRI